MARTVHSNVGNLSIILTILVAATSVLYYLLTHDKISGDYLFHEFFVAFVGLMGIIILWSLQLYIHFSGKRWHQSLKQKGESNNAANIKGDELGAEYEDNVLEGCSGCALKPPYSMKSEGINIIQLLGTMLFGIAGVVFSLLRIYDMGKDRHCVRVSGLLLYSVMVAFFISQTIFIFRFQHIRFLKHPQIIKLVVGIVFAANLCIWCHASLSEITEGVHEITEISREHEEESRHEEAAEEHSKDYAEAKCHEKLTEKAAPFLIPAIIEYAMLAAIIIFEMAMSAGKRAIERPVHHMHDVHAKGKCFHRSRMGVVIGCVILVITAAVVGIIYGIEHEIHNKHVLVIIFLCQKAVLLGASFIAFVSIFRNTRALEGKRKSNKIDEVLLLLTLCGSFIFYIIMIASNLHDLMDGEEDFYSIFVPAGFIVNGVVEIVQITLQTALIYELTCRCSDDAGDQKLKPGRTAIAILTALNYALWLMATFEIKKEIMAIQEQGHKNMGPATAVKIYLIVLPLLIFYRFHSSIFLASLWDEIYHRWDDEDVETKGHHIEHVQSTQSHDNYDTPL